MTCPSVDIATNGESATPKTLQVRDCTITSIDVSLQQSNYLLFTKKEGFFIHTTVHYAPQITEVTDTVEKCSILNRQ